MVATESNQLFTNRTSTVCLPLALLCMTDYPLHLVATRKSAVSVPTLTCVDQTLDTSLDAELPRLLRIIGRSYIPPSTVQIESKFLHFVRMSIILVTSNTQIEVFTNRAVVSSLHRLGTGVTVVHELVLAHDLCV